MQVQGLILVYLSCLRCGSRKVCFVVPNTITFCEIPDLMCDDCGAPHFLKIDADGVEYKRDTRRYPSDNYDDNDFPVITGWCDERPEAPPDEDRPGFGPITRYPRRRLSREEVRQVFKQSRGRCHLCGRRWNLADHGSYGWHADHVVAHSGGGWDTESLDNFLVACARCNLRKGRGYTPRDVRLALRELVETCIRNVASGLPDAASTPLLRHRPVRRRTGSNTVSCQSDPR